MNIVIQFYRGLYSYLVCHILAVIFQQEVFCDSKNDKLRILRNLIGTGYNVIIMLFASKIPFSDIFILQQISPYFIGFFDIWVYKSKYRAKEILVGAFSGIGAVIMIQPSVFGLQSSEEEIDNSIFAKSSERSFWRFLFLIIVFFWSISVILVKGMSIKSSLTQCLPFGISMSIWSCISMIILEVPSFSLSLKDHINLFISQGLLTGINAITYVKAIRLGKPGKVQACANTNLVLSMLLEYFYHDMVPGFYKILGSVVIVASTICLCILRN